MGILFPNKKPNVSAKEFDKIKRVLEDEGVSERTRDKVEMAFGGHMDQKGIDQKELDQALKILREKKGDYGVSEREIKKVEEQMKKRL